jgi:hypothetical protein
LIFDHAGTQGMPPVRLQRWLNAMVVTTVLDRVCDENDEPIFLLKGGVAMELRLQLRARATKDHDAAFRARAHQVTDKLDEALSRPGTSSPSPAARPNGTEHERRQGPVAARLQRPQLGKRAA